MSSAAWSLFDSSYSDESDTGGDSDGIYTRKLDKLKAEQTRADIYVALHRWSGAASSADDHNNIQTQRDRLAGRIATVESLRTDYRSRAEHTGRSHEVQRDKLGEDLRMYWQYKRTQGQVAAAAHRAQRQLILADGGGAYNNLGRERQYLGATQTTGGKALSAFLEEMDTIDGSGCRESFRFDHEFRPSKYGLAATRRLAHHLNSNGIARYSLAASIDSCESPTQGSQTDPSYMQHRSVDRPKHPCVNVLSSNIKQRDRAPAVVACSNLGSATLVAPPRAIQGEETLVAPPRAIQGEETNKDVRASATGIKYPQAALVMREYCGEEILRVAARDIVEGTRPQSAHVSPTGSTARIRSHGSRADSEWLNRSSTTSKYRPPSPMSRKMQSLQRRCHMWQCKYRTSRGVGGVLLARERSAGSQNPRSHSIAHESSVLSDAVDQALGMHWCSGPPAAYSSGNRSHARMGAQALGGKGPTRGGELGAVFNYRAQSHPPNVVLDVKEKLRPDALSCAAAAYAQANATFRSQRSYHHRLDRPSLLGQTHLGVLNSAGACWMSTQGKYLRGTPDVRCLPTSTNRGEILTGSAASSLLFTTENRSRRLHVERGTSEEVRTHADGSAAANYELGLGGNQNFDGVLASGGMASAGRRIKAAQLRYGHRSNTTRAAYHHGCSGYGLHLKTKTIGARHLHGPQAREVGEKAQRLSRLAYSRHRHRAPPEILNAASPYAATVTPARLQGVNSIAGSAI